MVAKMKILVVDDDQMVRELLRMICEEGGAEVFEASTCREAERLIQTVRFDLLLLDNGLSDGVGLEFLPYAKHFCPRVIMVTADEARISELALRLGAEAVLPKPFKPEKLRARVFGGCDAFPTYRVSLR